MATVCRHDDRWEHRHGGLVALAMYIRWLYHEAKRTNAEYAKQMTEMCLMLLTDKQVVVRMAAGQVLAALCEVEGIPLYEELVEERLLKSIEDNMYLERDDHVDEEDLKVKEKLLAGEAAQQAKLQEKAAGSDCKSVTSSNGSSKSSIFHDTAGWKTLETDVKALQSIMEACKAAFAPKITPGLIDVICQCAVHVNRFVRGISFQMIASTVKCAGLINSLDAVAKDSDLVSRLASGISDEWADVRMDASVAVRAFLQNLAPEDRLQHMDCLLPGMCLNRYYIAEGVRTYSHANWGLFMGAGGKELVVQFMPSVVSFYIQHSRYQNFEMREAACHCIAELFSKIDLTVVASHAPDLVEALLAVLVGGTWPVRIAAASALARAMDTQKQAVLPHLEKLVSILERHLADSTWSVREESSITLVAIVKTFGVAWLPRIVDIATEGLTSVLKQEDDHKKYNTEDLEQVKRLHDNDVKLHTDQKMIDCCSAGAAEDDADHHHHDHDEDHDHHLERWEMSDGCLYVVRELSSVHPAEATALLGAMAKAAGPKHYMRHTNLLQTLWKVLPIICKNVGKKAFKNHLEPFFDAMRYSLTRTTPGTTTKAEAVACISQLAVLIGPMIFSGRLQQYDPSYFEEMSALVPSLRGD